MVKNKGNTLLKSTQKTPHARVVIILYMLQENVTYKIEVNLHIGGKILAKMANPTKMLIGKLVTKTFICGTVRPITPITMLTTRMEIRTGALNFRPTSMTC